MKKFLLLLIKYIPAMQMVGILLLYFYYIIFNINNYEVFNIVFDNSIVITIILYVNSVVFEFCKWHKIIIINNYIATNLMCYHYIFDFIPFIYNIEFVITIFIIIYSYKHDRIITHEHKTKTIKKHSSRMYR